MRRTFTAGDLITERLRETLTRCDEVVVVLSSASRKSDWVLAEIGAGWGLGKRTIILLDKLSPRDIPQLLSGTKAFDLNDFERYLEEVAFRARKS